MRVGTLREALAAWWARCAAAGVVFFALLVSSCETTSEGTNATGAEPQRYEVTVETTPFYRLGPQQDAGPDMQLQKGTRMNLVKRGFGFSKVELDNGWPGWVATEDIGPASPEPEYDGGLFFTDNLEGNSAIVGRFSGDVALPDDFVPADLPDPDLAFPETPLINPGDVHEGRPEFRY